MRSARLVHARETTATALWKGDLSVSHVELMASAIHRREDVFASDGEPLLDAATECTPEEFRITTRAWRSSTDDMVANEETCKTHVRRYVDVADTLGEVTLGAFFDGDAGGTVVDALDAYTTMDPPGDPSPPRTLSQRRADTLVEIYAEVLARNGHVGHRVPNINGVFDYPTLADRDLGDLSTTLCEITGVGPVTRAVMERFCCNSRIGRIVMQGKSVVLDQGRGLPP